MPAENVEQAEQQTVDETIDNPEVIKKYKLGAEIVNGMYRMNFHEFLNLV